MKLLNYDRVLCLSPHPDDVEYSMSGTILKCSDTTFDVLCLTNGGDFDKTTGISRLDEVRSVWEVSNANNVNLHFSDVKYMKDKTEDSWVNYIETKFLKEHSYDCIITTSEIDSHFEHKIVRNLGPALTRGIWPNRDYAVSIMEYKSPSTLDTWIPNLFVDIESVYHTKLKMLQKFKSQQHHKYFDRRSLDAFHTNYQCSKKNMFEVEQFRIVNTFMK